LNTKNDCLTGGHEVQLANARHKSFQELLDFQHAFSRKIFDALDGFCPVRDPGWNSFLKEDNYL